MKTILARRRLLWLPGLAIFAAGIASAAEATTRPMDPDHKLDRYSLVWQDEFNGDKIDQQRWDYRTGPRLLSDQRPENVSVSDGCLRLALRKERAGKLDYTAGGVISRETFKFGYFESRFKCPAGKGWHTSFWLAPNHGAPIGSSQEIDICENDSVNLKRYAVNLHIWKPKHTSPGASAFRRRDLSADFHVWGCLWTPKLATFYFDGKQVGEQDLSAVTPDEASIWLTCVAANFAKTGHVDDSKLPAEAVFDWVRYYKADQQD